MRRPSCRIWSPLAGPPVLGEQLEDVLDVDQPHRFVERLLVDRHPRMLGLDEARDDLGEAAALLDGDDIGPGRHHVVDAKLLELPRMVDELAGRGGVVLLGSAVMLPVAFTEDVEDSHDPTALGPGVGAT